jgi:hypothetical protein
MFSLLFLGLIRPKILFATSMELVKETKQLLTHKDVLLAATWRYMVQAIWLFFPPILFLLLAHFCFWHVLQGKDLMVLALEDRKYIISPVFLCFILALIFWVIVTWYSTRIVAKAKEFQEPDRHAIWKIFLVQTPRVLAFTCITIILLAFFQLENSPHPELPVWLCYCLLALSYGWYYGIYKFWEWLLLQRKMSKQRWLQFLHQVRLSAYVILASSILSAVLIKTFASLILFLLGLQVGLVLLLILRREIDAANKTDTIPGPGNGSVITPRSPVWKKMRFIIWHKEDREYFRLFQWVSFLGVVVYIITISSLKVAITVGSFPFLLLAFGVLLGIGNIITTVSVLARFNFHMLFFLFSLLLGKFVDPHFTNIKKKENLSVLFSERQDIRDYFINWVNNPERKKILADSTVKKFPVYFVIANGGASRSGYWVASVLSKLQDTTEGKFANHLFCLSGASGGSVGNSTFFNLLRTKDELLKKDSSPMRYWNASTRYLESDFLSFTLGRLLGRDIFRHTVPAFKRYTKDRADALAYSLERAPGPNCFLSNSFATPFSSFVTQKKDSNYSLPVICINTTRMQDGSPGVISNISINDKKNYFNRRIDVLSLLRDEGKDKDEDMKLSTAVVLGASFPYLSPAGRIDSKACDTCELTTHYFVDGGYFDNSGAGIVNEMLIAINSIMRTEPGLVPYAEKLDFHVLHITNNDFKASRLHRINPFTNDILSPVQTILGSYGTQTLVNDQRLKNFLSSLYGDTTHYINIDLYSGNYDNKFSMNWVISDFQRKKMNEKLMTNTIFRKECDKMRHWRF